MCNLTRKNDRNGNIVIFVAVVEKFILLSFNIRFLALHWDTSVQQNNIVQKRSPSFILFSTFPRNISSSILSEYIARYLQATNCFSKSSVRFFFFMKEMLLKQDQVTLKLPGYWKMKVNVCVKCIPMFLVVRAESTYLETTKSHEDSWNATD